MLASRSSCRKAPTPDRLGVARCFTHRTRSRCALLAGLRILTLGAVLAFLSPNARAQDRPPSDLTQVSLEDLMNIEVTSVSKKEQKISRVAAAIFVITQEDIQHSGAKNIPDLLRMVPGINVAQINSNTWAISARGFNGQFANKMLVLIDGRTVYAASNSGVYWDVQDTVLEDIERIEVIRGPGATIWGTNAVNGVINIITKHSKATQGGVLTGGGGSYEQGGTLRYGATIGKRGHYRVFGKYFNRGSLSDFSGLDRADGWHMKRFGFRSDWGLSERDSLTVQGDLYGGVRGTPQAFDPALTGPFFTGPIADIHDTSGGNVLARWNHLFSGGSETSLQAYFDRAIRTDITEPGNRNTYDIDFQHHVPLGQRNDVVWGVGYRTISDRIAGNFQFTYDPSTFTTSITNAFVQDEINLVRDKVWFTVGTKVEHNDFTGFELQPSARLLWTPNNRHTLWAAYSNAIRLPSRAERHIRINYAAVPGPEGSWALVSFLGNPQFGSEDLDAYEVGYRFQPRKRLALDATAFVNDYDHLRSSEPSTPFFEMTPSPPHLVIPHIFDNQMFGSTYGAEASLDWAATRFWTLKGGYTWFVPSFELERSSADTDSIPEAQGSTPRNQFQVRSQLNLPHQLEFDTAVYRVGRLAAGNIPAYVRVDARLAWHVAESVELSVAAQNLLDPRHPEFFATWQSVVSTQPIRSVYGSLTWRF